MAYTFWLATYTSCQIGINLHKLQKNEWEIRKLQQKAKDVSFVKNGVWNWSSITTKIWQFQWKNDGEQVEFNENFETIKSLTEYFLDNIGAAAFHPELKLNMEQLENLNSLYAVIDGSNLSCSNFVCTICPVRLLVIRTTF